jgi:manganese transport protein
VQTLSAKLGIATSRNLAEMCREKFPRPVVFGMWVLMELVAMATDLAEFIGAAVGFNLLFGVPLLVGGLLTAAATFLILALERYGFRPLEAVITALVGVVAACYLVETVLDRPAWGQVLHHAVVPALPGTEAVILATGILGATVMPHAIFLHSALTQGRVRVAGEPRLRRLFRYEIVDVVLAMGLASLINAAMLIMAAATFHRSGMTGVATLEEAHRTLQPLLGRAAGWVFGLSLLTAGLSSSTVGTSAGQVIMQGFLRRHIPIWLRRLITVAPSLAVIALGLEPTRTLVLSQVILSFGLPFAIVPLVLFTADKKKMGELVAPRWMTALATLIAVVVIALNVKLVWDFLSGL